MIRRPMLAARETPDPIQYPVYGSYKFDGIRALNLKELVSRRLKLIPNEATRTLFSHKALLGFDGELIVGNPCSKNKFGISDVYNRTQSGVMTRAGDPKANFYVFDYVEDLGLPFEMRQDVLMLQMARLPPGLRSRVFLVEQKRLRNQSDLDRFEEKAIELGYEGVMGRSPDGPYKQGRATELEGYLFKVKRFVDGEMLITGFEELMRNTNPKEKNALGLTKRNKRKEGMVPGGTLGAVLGIWKGKDMRVGSGFTDDERDLIWHNKENYLHQFGKFKYQEVGMKDLPRVAVWQGLRSRIDL